MYRTLCRESLVTCSELMLLYYWYGLLARLYTLRVFGKIDHFKTFDIELFIYTFNHDTAGVSLAMYISNFLSPFLPRSERS